MRETESGLFAEEIETSNEIALSDEELDFLRSVVTYKPDTGIEGLGGGSIAEMSIRDAHRFFKTPELGTQETKTASFLHRKLGEILDKESAGEVGGGVYGELEGTEENGPIIFIRGDMDALPLSDNEAAHMCGHNIHMAWLLENARLLSAYKKNFGYLPFKKVVFIGEPNEEGIISPEIGAQKMIEGGLLDRVGKPDMILGAHFAAPQPEGEVRIDPVSATHSEGRFQYQIVGRRAAETTYELIYRVGKEFGGEDANSIFGKGTIVDNSAEATPESIVRITNSKLEGDERRLSSNILNRSDEVKLEFEHLITPEEIEQYVKSIEEEWGSSIQIETSLDDNLMQVEVKSHGGHVSQGGPNVKFVMAELLHNLRKNYSFNISGGDKAIEVMGCMRTKAADWQEKGREMGKRINQIARDLENDPKFAAAIKGEPPILDTPPVYNDETIRQKSLTVLVKAGITVSSTGMPMAPAESFGFWESMLDIPGLYISIGGGDKDELEKLKVSQEPVPEKYMHHSPAILDTVRANKAIPYGAVLSLIALELGKQYHK